jgi:ketosteroid isomerase-like protein
MSQANAATVSRFIRAYNARDPRAVIALLHPGVEWHTLAGPIFGVEVVHGPDEVLSFMFGEVLGALGDFEVTAEELSELPGDRVLVVGHYEGHGLASGARVRMRMAAVYGLDHGLIVFFQDFTTREEALQALEAPS